jgi:hypothetical protein
VEFFVIGYWLLVTGYWLLVTGYRALSDGCWATAPEQSRSQPKQAEVLVSGRD